MIYFDYAATTPVAKDIAEGYCQLVEKYFYNSESLYNQGIEVNRLQEKSRGNLAAMLNVASEELIFTSGGSEANNMALKGIALKYRNRGRHIISSAVEHSSIMATLEYLETYFDFEITYLPVDKGGKIDPAQLENAIREDTILVSLMHVNNEVGAINPLDAIKAIVARHPKCFLHVDMVQSLAKLPCDLTGIDLASFSAHKLHGVKGSGLLYRRKGVNLEPLIHGGNQEFGLRAGTHNAPANIILAKTLKNALARQKQHLLHTAKLKEHFLKQISTIEDVKIISSDDALPSIVSIAMVGYKPEVILHELEASGLLISTKSACSTRNPGVSRVIEQLGLANEIASSAFRISFSLETSLEDVATLAKALSQIKEKIRKSR
ncbi:MAG: cysteine desulfurase family protein [Erysipelotrichaceae bacterium]|nr:cysteine desulfurase family protein [Erysipelotrichaceae bacterium]MDD3808790.1 cysteine desulfurase family protein [Erysipelotrichaceae bacterium]